MADDHDPVAAGPLVPARPQPDAAAVRIEDLSERLDMMKREVDALQVAQMNERRPWYKDFSTLISILALLFSFGTTFVSYRRTVAQDIEAQRADLRAMLQRLAALPKENFEATLRHQGNPSAVATLGGYVNQENAMLARQAAEVARRLPSDKVSATEFFAVGLALQSSYNIHDAKYFYSRAIESAREFNDEIAAVRAYANLLFITGQPEAGRDQYRNALDIFSDQKYKGYNDYTRNSTHVYTELNWAWSEANIGAMPLAQQHITNAEGYISRLLPGPSTDQLRGQVAQAHTFLAGGAQPRLSTGQTGVALVPPPVAN